MKPVFQTIVDNQRGNCWQACVASLLNKDLHEVPETEFGPDVDWLGCWEKWLQSEGYTMVWFHCGHDDVWPGIYITPGTYCILSGRSPRSPDENPYGHAIVGQWHGPSDGIRAVHDPHPAGGFIKGQPERITFIFQDSLNRREEQ